MVETVRNLLLTGGFGYLGTRLADYFIEKNYNICLLIHNDNNDLEDWSKRFKVIKGNVTNINSLSGCCDGIDGIVHLASLNEIYSGKYPEQALQVNAYGTRNILEIASAANIKSFVYLSTFHIYGRNKGLISEKTIPNPIHDYAITHLFGEYYCLQFNALDKIPTTIIRFTNGYGAPVVKSINRWSLVLNDLCRMAVIQSKIELKSGGTQHRDFAWIDDLGQAIELIFSANDNETSGQVFNIGGECSLSIFDIAEIVCKEYNKKFHKNIKVLKPDDDNNINLKSETIQVDISKIKKLGYRPSNHIIEEIHRTFSLFE